MSFNYNDFGLEKENLYEILATTFTINSQNTEIIPNTACMGIRFIDDDLIKISPYPDTTTYNNLKLNKYLTINFVSDVSLYALAALKDIPLGYNEFSRDLYNYKDISEKNIRIPFIKEAWAFILGEVVEEHQKVKRNGLGEVELIEFTVQIFESMKKGESFKTFNRAESLALETIILATRLKVAKERDDKLLFDSISNKIMEYFEMIHRFGRNKNALKALEIVESYIKYLK